MQLRTFTYKFLKIFYNFCKLPYPCYHVLKSVVGQGHRSKQIIPSDPLTLKKTIDLDIKSAILSNLLSSKVMVKDVFCKMMA